MCLWDSSWGKGSINLRILIGRVSFLPLRTPLLTFFHDKGEEMTELEKTLDELEEEVMDEIENPYLPFEVTFPYVVRLSIPDDGHNTEITIRTRSQEVRFGRHARDILLQKEVDNQYGRETYTKHILDWVSDKLPNIDPRQCNLVYPQEPSVKLLDDHEVREYIEEVLDDD